MDITLNGLNGFLLSLMLSDLNQTAHFTGRGIQELNPIAKPIVQSESPMGEIGLGGLGLIGLMTLEKQKKLNPKSTLPYILQGLWTGGHGLAVLHNERKGQKDMNIVFPTLTVRW